MPKILKPGSGRPIVGVYQCTGKGNGGCGCNADLEVYEDDLYQTSRTHYSGDSDYFVTFACPDCGAETDIYNYKGRKSDLPTISQHGLHIAKNNVYKLLRSLCGDDITKWQKIYVLLTSQNDS